MPMIERNPVRIFRDVSLHRLINLAQQATATGARVDVTECTDGLYTVMLSAPRRRPPVSNTSQLAMTA